MKKKTVSLRDHKEVMELMKILYGANDVKDDTKIPDTDRKPGTKSISEVDESAPDTTRLFLQEQQRR